MPFAAVVPLLNLIIPALVPAVADGVRGIFSWMSGGAGAKPQNVAEQVQLMQAETERLKALSELDKPIGEISRWVANLRASFRYLAAIVVLLSGMVILGAAVVDMQQNPNSPSEVRNFAEWYLNYIVAPVWSFIFGERMWVTLRNGGKH